MCCVCLSIATAAAAALGAPTAADLELLPLPAGYTFSMSSHYIKLYALVSCYCYINLTAVILSR